MLQVDLGGICGRRSWLYPMVKALGVVDSFVDRMLMSVILVRDEVELQRFVVKPFTCFSTTAAAKAGKWHGLELGWAGSVRVAVVGWGDPSGTGRGVAGQGAGALVQDSAAPPAAAL